MTIVFYDPWTRREVGCWARNPDGTITATPRVQDILDVTLARTGSADEAWRCYRSWSNGYLASIEREDSG